MWPGCVTFGIIGHRFLEMCQIVGWTAMANLAALRAAVCSLSAKNLRGADTCPHDRVRGLILKNAQFIRWQWLINMSTQFQVDIFKNDWIMTSNMFFNKRNFRVTWGFCRVFRNFIFYRFWRFKKSFRAIFAFFAKIWSRNLYRSSKSRICFAWPLTILDLTILYYTIIYLYNV